MPNEPMANTWHGEFPIQNLLDGYEWTAPVGSFPPMGMGCEMTGNVWEWTSDWYQATHRRPCVLCGVNRWAATATKL
jgi:formylglycine-generating enzyme required for sulfatase activity